MDEQRKPIEMPSADVPDYSPEINALYDAQKAQQEQEKTEKTDQFWDVVGQLVAASDVTEDYKGKTFEPMIGIADASDSQARIVKSNSAAAAARKRARYAACLPAGQALQREARHVRGVSLGREGCAHQLDFPRHHRDPARNRRVQRPTWRFLQEHVRQVPGGSSRHGRRDRRARRIRNGTTRRVHLR